MRHDKKGVSTFIATVLLIVLAVTIGGVVIVWQRTNIEGTIARIDEKSDQVRACQIDMSIGIAEYNNRKRACYDSQESRLDIVVENLGDAVIAGVRVTMHNTDREIFDNVTQLSISPGGAQRLLIPYPPEFGTPQQIKITPAAKSGAGMVFCSEKEVVLENDDFFQC